MSENWRLAISLTGGRKIHDDGNWTWSDGSAFNYTNWASTRPGGDNPYYAQGLGGDCIVIYIDKWMRWYDEPCNWTHTAYVCSYDM